MHLKKKEIELIKSILEKHLSGVEVWAFGSRVAGKPHQYSDLDLLLKSKNLISLKTLSGLSEEFSDSPLPFKVELIDWHRIAPEFQLHLSKDLERLF